MDGCHFENWYIAISEWKIIGFSWNFVHSSRFCSGWMSRDQKWKSFIGQTLEFDRTYFLFRQVVTLPSSYHYITHPWHRKKETKALDDITVETRKVTFNFDLLHPSCCDTTGVYCNKCLSGLVKICSSWATSPKGIFCHLFRPHTTLTFDLVTPKVDRFMPMPSRHIVQICIKIGRPTCFQNIMFTSLVTNEQEEQSTRTLCLWLVLVWHKK